MRCHFLCQFFNKKVKFYQFQLFSAKILTFYKIEENLRGKYLKLQQKLKTQAKKLKVREDFPTP